MDVLGSIPALADGRLLQRETATVTYLEPLALSAHPRLRCAFTTRHAGRSGQALNLSFDKGERPAVLAHRQHVLQALGLEQTTLCTVRQVHGNQVCIVDAAMLQRGLTGIAADALVTNLPWVALGVLVADCLPIVLYALDTPVIALVHAGRMGTYHRVAQHALEMIEQRFATPRRTYMPCWGRPLVPVATRSTDAPSDLFRTSSPPGSSSSSPTAQSAGPWTCSPPTRCNYEPLASPPSRSTLRRSVPPATTMTCTPTALKAKRPGGAWPLWRSRLLPAPLSSLPAESGILTPSAARS